MILRRWLFPGGVSGEESLALGAVEDRGMFKARLFGRVQYAHSGHGRIRSGKCQGKRSFSLRVKDDECH